MKNRFIIRIDKKSNIRILATMTLMTPLGVKKKLEEI